MNPPKCRDCAGSGADYAGPGHRIDCERCQGAGVEFCLECDAGAPRVRVVAAYSDTCADGAPYESQVCAACARRLCGLIEMPAPCYWCGLILRVGETWGFLDGPHGPNYCDHIHRQRRCECCTSDWWAPWLDDAWDEDGCAKEMCPECVAANEADAAADAAGEPRVTTVYLHNEPPLAATALALVLARFACPVADDQYRALVTYDGRGGRA